MGWPSLHGSFDWSELTSAGTDLQLSSGNFRALANRFATAPCRRRRCLAPKALLVGGWLTYPWKISKSVGMVIPNQTTNQLGSWRVTQKVVSVSSWWSPPCHHPTKMDDHFWYWKLWYCGSHMTNPQGKNIPKWKRGDVWWCEKITQSKWRFEWNISYRYGGFLLKNLPKKMADFRTLQQSIADITRGSPQILMKIFQARKLGTFDSEGK